jgi:hypothetical protein
MRTKKQSHLSKLPIVMKIVGIVLINYYVKYFMIKQLKMFILQNFWIKMKVMIKIFTFQSLIIIKLYLVQLKYYILVDIIIKFTQKLVQKKILSVLTYVNLVFMYY